MKKKSSIKRGKSHVFSDDSDAVAENQENKKRLTFDMPAALHRELKIYSVKTGQTMGEIINQLLTEKIKTAVELKKSLHK
jgi:hypothetical protein